jgi:hypothetical protein
MLAGSLAHGVGPQPGYGGQTEGIERRRGPGAHLTGGKPKEPQGQSHIFVKGEIGQQASAGKGKPHLHLPYQGKGTLPRPHLHSTDLNRPGRGALRPRDRLEKAIPHPSTGAGQQEVSTGSHLEMDPRYRRMAILGFQGKVVNRQHQK